MAVAHVRYHTGFSIKTAGATNVTVNITTTTTAGNTLVARILFDNAAVASKPVVSTIFKAAGETNNWVFLGAARSTSTSAGAFASGEMWAIQTTVSWPVANYGVTLDTSVTMKATYIQEFSGVLAIPRSTEGTAYSATTTAASATTTGTAPAIGDLALGFIFGSNVAAAMAGDNDTTGGSWSGAAVVGSTGGGGATNNYGVGQYKILTTASHQTLNNSAAMTAGNGAIVAILQQYVPAAISQAAYQFFEDGTETGSVALAPQNTAPTVNVGAGDVNVQLRVRLQSTTAITDEPANFRLYFHTTPAVNPTRPDAFLPVTAPGPEEQIAGYDIANRSANYELTQGTGVGYGGILWQFNSVSGVWPVIKDGRSITRIEFALAKTGTPTGTFSVWITWAGSSNNLFQTAVPIATATLPTTVDWYSVPLPAPWALADAQMTPGWSSPWSGGFMLTTQAGNTVGNGLLLGMDTTSPTDPHDGYRYDNTTSTWVFAPSVDPIYRVYAQPWSHVAVPYDSPNLTGTGPTTNRLTGGTGSFVAGEVTEDGTANAIALPGNNYTELLFSFTLVAADLTDGEVLKFKVGRNDGAGLMTYTVEPQLTVTVVTGPGPVNLGTASSSGVATVTAAIGANRGLASTASTATSTTTSALAVGRPLAAASNAASTATGTLTTAVAPIALAGSSSGITTIGTGTANLGYRLFNGTSDGLTVNIGNLASTSLTPTTWIFAGRFLGLGVLVASGGYGAVDWFVDTGPDLRWYDGSGASPDNQPVLPGPVDVIAVFRLPSSGVMRHSLATHNGTSWSSFTHADSGWDPGNPTLPSSGVLQVGFGMSEAWINARFAALAVCSTVLSDADVDTLTTNLAAWQALASLTNLWRFDQTPVVDLKGSATQNTVTGTTVTAGAFPLLGGGGGGGIDLLVTRGLAGAANGIASTTSALAIARPLVAASAGAATTTAALSRATPLTTASAGVSSASGTLSVGAFVALASTVAGTSTTTSAINVTRGLAATIAGGSTVTSALAIARPLAATSTGVAGTVAPLLIGRGLTAASTGAGAASGSLAVGRTVTAASAGVSTTTGTMIVDRALVAGSAGVSTVTAGLVTSQAGGMASFVSGLSTVTGSLGVARPLAAASSGVSTVTAATGVNRAMTASSAGLSTPAGNARVTRGLVAAANGAGSAGGVQFVVARRLTSTAGGVSTVTGELTSRPLTTLQGASVGSSTATGTLVATSNLIIGWWKDPRPTTIIDQTFDGAASTPLTAVGWVSDQFLPMLVLDGAGNAMTANRYDGGATNNVGLPAACWLEWTVNLAVPREDDTEVYLQWAMPNRYWYYGYNVLLTQYTGEDRIRILRSDNGTTGSAYVTFQPTNVVRVEHKGATITVDLNGVRVITWTDPVPLTLPTRVGPYTGMAIYSGGVPFSDVNIASFKAGDLNGISSETVAMMWGDQDVVDWMLTEPVG